MLRQKNNHFIVPSDNIVFNFFSMGLKLVNDQNVHSI
jgi:hypothetical protein